MDRDTGPYLQAGGLAGNNQSQGYPQYTAHWNGSGLEAQGK